MSWQDHESKRMDVGGSGATWTRRPKGVFAKRKHKKPLAKARLICNGSAEVILKATKVDGIYDSDPKKNPKAVRFHRISYIDALQKQLKVMDSTAFSLCMDNKMPIIVFDLFRAHNLKRVVLGDQVGTLVTG